jgi:hypothetical protein
MRAAKAASNRCIRNANDWNPPNRFQVTTFFLRDTTLALLLQILKPESKLSMTRIGIRTLFGDIEVDDLRPWLEACEGIPQLLTSRARSRVHGDDTGMDDFKLNHFYWLTVGSDTTTAATGYVFLSSKLDCMLTNLYRNLTKMNSVTTTPTPRHFPAY